jgi:ferritin
MLSKKMQAALNKQLNAEMYSSYLYLSMAAWLEAQNLKGMAHWMKAQAKEEHGHAMKFFDFILDRLAEVNLAQIAAPATSWASPLAAFEAVRRHEAKVTGLISDLAEQAAAEKDHATAVFLHWFINEQVEEEAAASEILGKLEAIGDSVGGLHVLDHHMGKRGGE